MTAMRAAVLVATVALLAPAAASTGAAKPSISPSAGLPPPPCWRPRVYKLTCGGYRRELFRATFEGRQETTWTQVGSQCGTRGSGSQTLMFSTPKPVLAAVAVNKHRQLLYRSGIIFDSRENGYQALPVEHWMVTRQATFECGNEEIRDCGTRAFRAALPAYLDPQMEVLGRRTRLVLSGGVSQATQRVQGFRSCPFIPRHVCVDPECAKPPPAWYSEGDGDLMTDDNYFEKGVLDGAAGHGPLYALIDCHVHHVRVTQPGFTVRFDQDPFGGKQTEWHSTTTVHWTLTLTRIGCAKK